MKIKSCSHFWAEHEEMSCAWSVNILLVSGCISMTPKRGISQNTVQHNLVRWSKLREESSGRNKIISKGECKVKSVGRRGEKRNNTHLGEWGNHKGNNPRTGLVEAIRALLGLFSAALHLSHSYWRGNSCYLQHNTEELLKARKNTDIEGPFLRDHLALATLLCAAKALWQCMV